MGHLLLTNLAKEGVNRLGPLLLRQGVELLEVFGQPPRTLAEGVGEGAAEEVVRTLWVLEELLRLEVLYLL